MTTSDNAGTLPRTSEQDANAIRAFVAWLRQPTTPDDPPCDGSLVLVDEIRVWVRADPEKGSPRASGDWYEMASSRDTNPPGAPVSLDEVLGYDEVPADRNVLSCELLMTGDDVARAATGYLAMLESRSTA